MLSSGIWRSLLSPADVGSSFADFSILKMEAIRSSETSVHTRPTRRHIPEDGFLYSHRCGNLKSYIEFFNFQKVPQIPLLDTEVFLYKIASSQEYFVLQPSECLILY
jgi:hypothetical protein